MNKKTIKIAGWALGLSMAVAGIGTAVSASQKAPVETLAASTTYAVKDAVYELATEISAGDKIIFVSTYEDNAMGTQDTNNRKVGAVTKNDSATPKTVSINANNSVAVFTVAVSTQNSSYWTFNDGSGYLYNASTSKKNYLKTQESVSEDGYADWSVTITNGVASIGSRASSAANKLTMSYNASSDLFACYASLQTNGGIAIYKEAAPEADDWEFASISLSTGVGFKDEYYLDDEFDKTGITVTYTEHSETLGENRVTSVANDATFNFDSSEIGRYKLTATYEGHTTTDEVYITIVRAPIDYSSISYGGYGNRLESNSDLVAGMKLVIASDAYDAIAGYLSNSVLTSADASDCFSTVDDVNKVAIGDGNEDVGVLVLTLGGSTGAWTLQNKAGKYLYESSEKKMGFKDDSATCTITISSGTATVTFTNKLQYNSGSPRFTTYTSSQKAIQLYSFTEYIDEANDYAESFNDANVCGTNDNTQAIKSVWDAQSTAFSALSVQAKNILKAGAGDPDASEAIPLCLARYDRVMSLKNAGYPYYSEFANFMNRSITPLYASNGINKPFQAENNIPFVITIGTITAIASTSAIALFLRRRKED